MMMTSPANTLPDLACMRVERKGFAALCAVHPVEKGISMIRRWIETAASRVLSHPVMEG
jgi:hypothetical protein